MTLKLGLPMLAFALPLSLGACAAKPERPQAIPAVAEQRQCPAFPLPPKGLVKPPVKIDFLTPPRRSSGQATP